ncbi:MAG: type 1 glutamine amidotransferase [Acidobacteriota bacterium]|nr:type 1 glutamine amidotransferase [Acidobacteriota bacterium]
MLLINLLHQPQIQDLDLADADVMILGGAGAHSALDDHPFTEPLSEVVVRWIDDGRPVFGSCWGHQFLGRLLGGSLIHDEERQELGSYRVETTETGRRDPLLEGLPESFTVQLGHHDRIDRLPPAMEELARSELCCHQLIRLRDKPVYGSQFHPELRREDFLDRLAVYRREYAPGAEAMRRVEEGLRPSLEANGLLRRFLELYA